MRARLRIPGYVSALAGYLAVEAVYFHSLLQRFTTHILSDDIFQQSGKSDSYVLLWVYWWIQRQMRAGGELLFCNWAAPPEGATFLFDSQRLLPTALTLPVAARLGYVAGYNAMILLLLLLAAMAFYLMLARAFELSFPAAFLGGLAFGFSPYFIVKAHMHANLIGAGFWGGALGVLLYAYVRGRFGWRSGMLFSALVWATFWTSFLEFFLLFMACAMVVVAFELRPPGRAKASLRLKAIFLACVVPGALSLLFLARIPWSRDAMIARLEGVPVSGLVSFPQLSVLSPLQGGLVPEYGALYPGAAALVLAGLGFVRLHGGQPTRSLGWTLAGLFVVSLAIALDAGGLPSGLFNLIPRGNGFRVMSRFFPVALFFLVALAAIGLEGLMRWKNAGAKWAALAALAAVAAAEYYPARLQPSPVRSFAMSDAVRHKIQDGWGVMVLPEGEFQDVDNTYQCSLDMPAPYSTYLTMGGRRLYKHLRFYYPAVYDLWWEDRPRVWDEEMGKELATLHIGYILAGNRTRLAQLPPMLHDYVLASDGNMTLIEVPH